MAINKNFAPCNLYTDGDNNNLPKKISEVDIKNYAKYILLEGTKQEKRDLLECLKSKLILKDKVLEIEK